MDPEICIHCASYWRIGHSDSCPQVTNVYPVTDAEKNIVCIECHEPLEGHYTTVDSIITCLGCAALLTVSRSQ